MSRSQFQSRLCILRHAWLNLWDERIITGRINQITFFYFHFIIVIIKAFIHSCMNTSTHQHQQQLLSSFSFHFHHPFTIIIHTTISTTINIINSNINIIHTAISTTIINPTLSIPFHFSFIITIHNYININHHHVI